MLNTEFNKKYGISKEFKNKIHFSKTFKNNNSVVGKPKILFLEIVKRFFKNPMVIISVIVFVTLMVTAISVYYFSPYIANQRVDKNWANPTSNISNLPPEFSPWVLTEKGGQISKDITKLESGIFKEYTAQYAQWKNSDANQIYYNAYSYRYGMHLYAELLKWRTNHGGAYPDSTVVNSIKNTMTTLKTYFGTTANGADVWTTIWVGTLQSMKIALIVAIIETVVGVAVGCYLGFHAGKWLDTIMMRVIEIFQSPPSIIWLLLFVSIWGTNDWVLIGGLLFVGWTWPIGSARMFIITVKDEEYILAAKSIGASTPRQIYLHALPAIAGKLAMNFVRRIPSIILTVASLAFLGFFKDENSSNLGKFMLDNLPDSEKNPWLLILPTTILLALSLSLQFIAIGLHDALDPRVIKTR